METTHTPGLWHFDEETCTIRSSVNAVATSPIMADYRGCVIADISASIGEWPTLSRQHAVPEAMANARLIAAAPFMLAVLEQVLFDASTMMDDKSKTCGKIDRITILARESIALATQPAGNEATK